MNMSRNETLHEIAKKHGDQYTTDGNEIKANRVSYN